MDTVQHHRLTRTAHRSLIAAMLTAIASAPCCAGSGADDTPSAAEIDAVVETFCNQYVSCMVERMDPAADCVTTESTNIGDATSECERATYEADACVAELSCDAFRSHVEFYPSAQTECADLVDAYFDACGPD